MASFCRFLLWILWQLVQVGVFASCCLLLTYSCVFLTLPFSSFYSVFWAVFTAMSAIVPWHAGSWQVSASTVTTVAFEAGLSA